MNLFDRNLQLLKMADPILAQRVREWEEEPDCEVVSGKDGNLVPIVGGIGLHSRYDPVKEGRQWAESLKINPGQPLLAFGLGFGYHLDSLLEVSTGSVYLVEPSLSLFKQFLAHRDLSPYLGRTHFWIGEPPAKIPLKLGGLQISVVSHPASARLHGNYLNGLLSCLEAARILKDHSLRVLIIPPLYGGSLPTAYHCKAALEDMGHTVGWVDCEPYAEGFFAVQNVTQNKDHAAILSSRFLELLEEVIAAKASEFKPDLILGLAQAPMGTKLLDRLKVLEAPLAFWFVEDFRTLTYWKDTAAGFDHYFTIQKGEFLGQLHDLGVKDAYYLPQAANPELQKPVSLTQEEETTFGGEVTFMGAAYYNRLQAFAQLLDTDLKIWGTGWDPESIFGPCLQMNGDRVSSEDCVRIFNGSRVNLNLHSSTFHEGVNPHGDFVNPRTFEIAACGAFQLVDERRYLHEMFDLETELVTFRSIDKMKEQISWYLAHPEEAIKIAKKSRARVLADHTFMHRMSEMLIHIFSQNLQSLEYRVIRHQKSEDYLLDQARKDPELWQSLKQFQKNTDLSIQSIAREIQKGDGELSRNELLLLMVEQVVK